jgi:mannose-6-phosphate isomerase
VIGVAQNYAWGQLGLDSAVGRLIQQNESIDPNKPYAELWLGTHVSGPSQIQKGGSTEPLSEFLKINEPGYQEGLPYLLKVLSIKSALSIQAHPDAELARELHRKFPVIYRDPNHKPELAIALTPMDAMCSFRSLAEIAHFLETVPELRKVVGERTAEHFLAAVSDFEPPLESPYGLPFNLQACLRDVFQSMMEAKESVVCEQLKLLLARLPSSLENCTDPSWQYLAEQIQKISTSFPGDVGVFAVFLLNVFRLEPGEAIFLAQNEPHAYLFGDCIECMATSDNVVRAGLTPKFKDVDTLVRMLTYKCGKPLIYHGPPSAPHVTYAPPVDEFVVERFTVQPGQEVDVPIKSPTLFLSLEATQGVLLTGPSTQHDFLAGQSFFAQACTTNAKVSNKSSSPAIFFVVSHPPCRQKPNDSEDDVDL